MARLKGSVRKKAQQQQNELLGSRFEANETCALSESARVYCAGYHHESNKAKKEYQRNKKASVSADTASDRRTERSLVQAKQHRRDSCTVGLTPHKTSCRLFKLRFPGSSYQRACDPHHIDNLDFGRWVKENDSGWATFLLSIFCSAFNAILPLYTFICCLHEVSCPSQLSFFVPTSLYLESAVEGDTPPKLYLRGDYDALRWYLRILRAL